MAAFIVWSKIERVVEDKHMCIVAAVPGGEPMGVMPVDSESRLLPSHALAVECCAEMVRAMHSRLAKRGDRVVRTELA